MTGLCNVNIILATQCTLTLVILAGQNDLYFVGDEALGEPDVSKVLFTTIYSLNLN